MDCPICGTKNLRRDSVDIGIGIINGPYGCDCGWSEDKKYDIRSGPKLTNSGYKIDQWGGFTPPK